MAARHQFRNLLQVENQVRPAGRIGCEATKGIGTRKQPPQADVCRSLARESGAERCHRRKALKQIDQALELGLKGINLEPGAYPAPLYPDARR